LVIVRPATAADHSAIRSVVAAAFDRAEEADIVEAVRANGDVLVELVAAMDGKIVGHVLFNRMTCRPALFAAGLAPLAVVPNHQSRGIGAALARSGLKACRDLGAKACVVLGAPAYYGRFGFSAAPNTIASPYAGLAAFQAFEFEPGVLAHPITVAYPSAFG
jgi:putative acetyltransferase